MRRRNLAPVINLHTGTARRNRTTISPLNVVNIAETFHDHHHCHTCSRSSRLIAGVLILIMPRLLNFIVAIYLIVDRPARARPLPLGDGKVPETRPVAAAFVRG